MEKGLHDNDKAKKSESIQEEEKPHQYPWAVLEQCCKQDYGAKRSDDEIYYDVVEEPAAPIGEFVKAHHSHTISDLCFFLSHHPLTSAEHRQEVSYKHSVR